MKKQSIQENLKAARERADALEKAIAGWVEQHAVATAHVAAQRLRANVAECNLSTELKRTIELEQRLRDSELSYAEAADRERDERHNGESLRDRIAELEVQLARVEKGAEQEAASADRLRQIVDLQTEEIVVRAEA